MSLYEFMGRISGLVKPLEYLGHGHAPITFAPTSFFDVLDTNTAPEEGYLLRKNAYPPRHLIGMIQLVHIFPKCKETIAMLIDAVHFKIPIVTGKRAKGERGGLF